MQFVIFCFTDFVYVPPINKDFNIIINIMVWHGLTNIGHMKVNNYQKTAILNSFHQERS